jgi:GT2 family glycosyltransferase
VIPVLGVPVLVRHDLLDDMLRSVDEPVDQLVVIDNGRPLVPPQWPPVAKHVTYLPTGHNLGVGASWTLVLQLTPLAPWWLIAGFDVTFDPGALRTLVEAMETASGPRFAMLGTPDALALNAACVETVGLWDLNLHPAYFEDNDYARRMLLAGVEVLALPARLQHGGSMTIKSDEHLREQNDRTFPINQRYYLDKWGGPPLHEEFTTPFNRGGSIKDWTLDFERLRRMTWR